MRSSIAGRRSLVSSPVRWSAASVESVDPQKKAEDGRRVRKWVRENDMAALITALNDDPQLWLSEPDDNGYEPLHWAVLKANLPMVRLLVARGANLEGVEHGDGSTPLMLAVRMEHPQVSSVLIEGRANVHVVDRYSNCLLRWAAKSNQHRTLQQLLEARGRDDMGLSTSDELVLQTGQDNVRISQRERDGDVNEAMRIALRAGHAESVRRAVRWGGGGCGAG